MVNKPTSLDCLEAAMKSASLRQQAIANNIANLDTPDYRRGVVEFEQVLAKAIQSGDPVKALQERAQLTHPCNTPVDETGNDVNLDMEIADLMKNTSAQKTYLRLMAKIYNQMELAMRAE
jgi:flagellar basal-body rod protein FlgB